ncbi:hypothetical protein C3L33_18443, partial [Rhododendron williamsianum]
MGRKRGREKEKKTATTQPIFLGIDSDFALYVAESAGFYVFPPLRKNTGIALVTRWRTRNGLECHCLGDVAISIAVLHHLRTESRRKKAIDELIRVVKKGGLVLITVWAVEQEDRSLVNEWTPLTDKYVEEWIGPSDPCMRIPPSLTLESIPEAEENIGGVSTCALANGLGKKDDKKSAVVYNRYYHVFSEEKSSILKQLNGTDVLNAMKSGFIEGEENAEKAKEKEENEHLMNALKALVKKSILSENVKKDIAIAPQQDKPDSYDKLVKEMGLDMRARLSERTKTPEEIVQDEKERLEQLERQKRMLAADDSSDEDGNAYEVAQRPKSISGDDLGNSFSIDEEKRTKRNWIEQILARKIENDGGSEHELSSEDPESDEDDGDEEGTDEDSDEDDKTNSLKDWEQSDDGNVGTDLEGEEEEDEGDEMEPKRSKKGALIGPIVRLEKTKGNGKMPPSQPGELPYVIAAPKSLEELSALFENRSDSQIVEAISQIRTCNAISIAAGNRKKMQMFYGVLLQFFAVTANKRPLNFKLLNLLVKPLIEMSGEIPYFDAICAHQRLLWTRTQFCEDVKNPAVLLMCEYLMRCPIMSGQDIALGSFLYSMVHSVSAVKTLLTFPSYRVSAKLDAQYLRLKTKN